MKKLLQQFFKFEKDELPVVILLFGFSFLTIAVFQMLKPAKKGLFVEIYGAEVELYAKLANIVVAALAMAAFTYLYNRVHRRVLIYCICGFFLLTFSWLIPLLSAPGASSIWGFYLLGDLVTTLLVSAFWAYATDITSAEQAKRLFGVVGAGLVLGGWVGISYSNLLLKTIGSRGLLFSSAVIMVILAGITSALERKVTASPSFKGSKRREPEPGNRKTIAALEGAVLALRSPYLAAIVGLMGMYEMASQVMDFQFTKLAEELAGVATTQIFIARVYFFANLLSVVVQFFFVSLVMRRFGLTTTLLVMPVAFLLSSVAFLAYPVLLVSGFLVISDNGLNYSIQQTGRESLYTVTTPDEKYKARAFTNMFVQRFAKGLAILAVLALSQLAVPLNLLSIVTITVVTVMIMLSTFAGRRFHQKAESFAVRGASPDRA